MRPRPRDDFLGQEIKGPPAEDHPSVEGRGAAPTGTTAGGENQKSERDLEGPGADPGEGPHDRGAGRGTPGEERQHQLPVPLVGSSGLDRHGQPGEDCQENRAQKYQAPRDQPEGGPPAAEQPGEPAVDQEKGPSTRQRREVR